MSIKLRDLIRNVRACKTAAEERAVIAKECALIRTSFKDEDSTFRHRNVAKLLYIHMLGYPSHFGQLEAIKLIASPRFLDKRIGYLALTILVEEKGELLTLVTNSLSSDLGHRNPYIQGLALSALGNVSNRDMLRDLSGPVLKLLSNPNVYVRKKAALCSTQIFKKVPDMVEDFLPVVISMLQDRNHAVQLTAVTLLVDVVGDHPQFLKKVRKTVTTLVQMLKNLVTSNYAPEYDVNGIADPFLQVKILRLLGRIGKRHKGAMEQMTDILAQVATNTEAQRNAGNSILYECVQTIVSLDCEEGLEDLAISILGRFLQNRENNIRYVALYMLHVVVEKNKDAVQRHSEVIVDCLRDSDSSIRVRAIDLVFALINRDSVEKLTKEILNYLVVASAEHKQELCNRLADTALRFAPSKAWHVHTLISMLCIAGEAVRDVIWHTAIALIGQPESEDFRPQVVHRLYEALAEDASKPGLVYTAVWTIGEFGLVLGTAFEKEEGTEIYEVRTEDEVLDLLESVRHRHDANLMSKSMIMNAYVKLSVRFEQTKPRIADLVKAYENSMNAELQARSCEFSKIVDGGFDGSLTSEWLAQMPTPTDEEMAERRVRMVNAAGDKGDEYEFNGGGGRDGSDEESEDTDVSDDSDEEAAENPKRKTKKSQAQSSGDLIDLDDMFGGGSGNATNGALATSPKQPQADQMDLLAGIFGGETTPAAPASTSASDDLLEGFGGSESRPSSAPSIKAFEKDGIEINMDLERGSGENEVILTAKYTNNDSSPVSDFLLQGAVPKYISLRMEQASGNVLEPHATNTVQQKIHLVNSMRGTKPIVMKIRISYRKNGQEHVEQATVQGFPTI